MSRVDLKGTTDRPQMDSGQSTVSRGWSSRRHYRFRLRRIPHGHRKKTGRVGCAFVPVRGDTYNSTISRTACKLHINLNGRILGKLVIGYRKTCKVLATEFLISSLRVYLLYTDLPTSPLTERKNLEINSTPLLVF